MRSVFDVVISDSAAHQATLQAEGALDLNVQLIEVCAFV